MNLAHRVAVGEIPQTPQEWDRKTQTKCQEKRIEKPLPLSNGQAEIGKQLNTDWQMLWLT